MAMAAGLAMLKESCGYTPVGPGLPVQPGCLEPSLITNILIQSIFEQNKGVCSIL
jgi:hypothetical protein